MQAVVYTAYGPPDVLQLKEVAKPTPSDDEVLIRVRAATVTAGDVNIRGFVFVPPGFRLLARFALQFGEAWRAAPSTSTLAGASGPRAPRRGQRQKP